MQQFVAERQDALRVFFSAGTHDRTVDRVIRGDHCDPDDADDDAERHQAADDLHRKAHPEAEHERADGAERIGEDLRGAAGGGVQFVERFQFVLFGGHTA